MRIVFLGTNGWYDTRTGNTICILVETPQAIVILDAGNGLQHADQYFAEGKPVHLFLSHLHLDHIIGLHLLNKFNIPNGLTIHCRKGDRAHLEAIIAPPYSLPFEALPYPVHIVELDDQTVEQDGYSVSVAPMRHAVPTIGFRFEIAGKVLAYCPDTGYCQSAVDLSRGADLLIAECAFRPGEESAHWPHLNPETAARLALDAGAKQLALVHFDAYRYPDMESRRNAEHVAQSIFPAAIAASDQVAIEL